MSIITIVALLVILSIQEGESNVSILFKHIKCLNKFLCCEHTCTPVLSVNCLFLIRIWKSAVCFTLFPFLISHNLRYMSGGSRSESSMSMHRQGEKAHWTLHRTGGGASCQLTLQWHWDNVSPGAKGQHLFFSCVLTKLSKHALRLMRLMEYIAVSDFSDLSLFLQCHS